MSSHRSYPRLLNLLQNLRFNLWWNHLIPPVLTVIYFTLAFNEIPLDHGLLHVFGFIPVIVGVAGFGYLINDLTDFKQDASVGKKNIVNALSKPGLLLLISFLLICLLSPWVYLDLNWAIIILLGAQILIYLLYSIPPFRFKERGFLGILSDSFYGHLNPILVTIFTFASISSFKEGSKGLYPFILIVIWAVTKGIRNIMLHQLDDRKNDRKTGINTFVLSLGALPSVHTINRLILPLEMLLVSILVFLASQEFEYFYIGFIAFLFFTWLKFNGPKFTALPKRQFKFKFLHFMNDFYEEWLPLIVLIYLTMSRPEYAVLLIIHLIIFPHILRNFYLDCKDIGKNMREL